MNQSLLAPLCFYLFYIVALMVWNFFRRKNAIKSKELSIKYFRSYSDKQALPEYLLVHERHVDHQFQLPPIFMIVCSMYLGLELVSPMTIFLAWSFVASRLVHSWVHLGTNNVLHRAATYFVGWIIVLIMAISLCFGAA